jgi:drug/metabolite transporter superfamily protein YnfA
MKKILYSLFFFFIAGLCEIGGGYLVWLWLWLREDMSWILGVIGGFVLFLYGIVPTSSLLIFTEYTLLMEESLLLWLWYGVGSLRMLFLTFMIYWAPQ